MLPQRTTYSHVALICATFTLAGCLRDLLISSGLVINSFTFFGAMAVVYGLIAYFFTRASLDLQRRLQAEHELQIQEHFARTARFEQIGLLAAGMAHDFRNYLAILQGTASLIEKSVQNKSSASAAFRIQHKCFDQARGTIEHVMSIVRTGNAHSRKIRPVHDVLDDALLLAEILVEKSGVEIKKSFEHSKLRLQIHDITLMQCIINIVKNAAEASRPGDSVHVSTNTIMRDSERLFSITIEDSGLGMSEQCRRTIFTPLITTKQDGTGIGLATVKSLIENEQGSIEVVSKEGRGTKMVISYPFREVTESKAYYTPQPVRLPQTQPQAA